jgi:hypothetical protein
VMRADEWARERARKVLGLATQDLTPEAVS